MWLLLQLGRALGCAALPTVVPGLTLVAPARPLQHPPPRGQAAPCWLPLGAVLLGWCV